ncbi:molybdopterin synthase subunit MoaD [Murinocardiopsis flavida]|uniref:Molybdopterin synthase subunit MoaD n=1 Tax=Murinocardiopsis flavida TaxID=645275 RepID=A0A2P8DMN6_9ACTN|nr:MoaD/ThiS family protein [Murinocardiopsis flavida]PSK98467.1 molybdopterin synthase subunit MoaD [Murinocardiopsis flavida]
MAVKVFVPQVLRPDCDGAVTIDLAMGSGPVPLRSVLDELAARHPRLDKRLRDDQGKVRRYVNVFVDDDECRAVGGLDAPVGDGAEVRVLPSVAGG